MLLPRACAMMGGRRPGHGLRVICLEDEVRAFRLALVFV